MKFELMASMMCANYGNLEKEVCDFISISWMGAMSLILRCH